MFAPVPQLAACLEVLYLAALDARVLGWSGEREGLGSDQAKRLADLMDAVHNVPKLAAEWERCDEQLLREMLGDYDARHGGGLLKAYDRVVAERSRSS
jgi:hypothetical protein